MVVETEKRQDPIKWWIKYKNQIYGVLLVLVGLMGGNADRISSGISDLLPDAVFVDPNEFNKSIDDLNLRVDNLTIRVDNLEQTDDSDGDDEQFIPIE